MFRAIKEAIERKMVKDFIDKNVKHWGNLLPILFAVLAFLEPSVNAYTKTHPHTFAAIVLGVLYGFYHAQPPRNSSGNKTDSPAS